MSSPPATCGSWGGEVASLLRREGVSSSRLAMWQQLRAHAEAGEGCRSQAGPRRSGAQARAAGARQGDARARALAGPQGERTRGKSARDSRNLPALNLALVDLFRRFQVARMVAERENCAMSKQLWQQRSPATTSSRAPSRCSTVAGAPMTLRISRTCLHRAARTLASASRASRTTTRSRGLVQDTQVPT